MQYEMKGEPEYIGAPKQKNETTYSQTLRIRTGIVGQAYEGFVNKDIIEVDFPSTDLDADGIKALLLSASTQFVLTKYPGI
jgi:hypothetical protein